MLCPKCKGDTKVFDTRFDGKENEIFRHRICKTCGNIFFTIEFDIEHNNKVTNLWKTLVRGSSRGKGSKQDEQ